MKKLFSLTLVLCLLVSVSFSQIKFSDEVRKFIDYDASIIVLTNALLIDAKGRQAKSNQTIVVSDGRIQWVGDDAKAVLPKGAQIIDVGGKAVMPRIRTSELRKILIQEKCPGHRLNLLLRISKEKMPGFLR